MADCGSGGAAAAVKKGAEMGVLYPLVYGGNPPGLPIYFGKPI